MIVIDMFKTLKSSREFYSINDATQHAYEYSI